MNILQKFGNWLKVKQLAASNTDLGSSEFCNAGLQPNKNAKIDEAHRMLLDKALDPNSCDIKNIAITGPFGSGKSSLIHSYLSSNKIKSTSVTLAGFNGTKIDDKGLDAIEKKLVDQLAAKSQKQSSQWSPTSFPSSRASKWQRGLQLFFLILMLTTVVVIAINTIAISNAEALGLKPLNVFKWTFGSLLLLIALFSLAFLRCGCPPLIKQLSLNNSGITLGTDLIEGSYFDKNIALILQIIDELDADVIVFEDIDRLKQPDLFTKLRELNQVINSHVGEARTVKFIYCLLDTMFMGKEKVKFFDIIIPIVPVLGGYNSFGSIKDELGTSYVQDLDEGFLRNVAMYLDDLRLIKNTAVEYKVYFSKLNAKNRPEIDRNSLLAIVTLKNLHANSFHGLENRTGELYDFLSPFKENTIKGDSASCDVKDVVQSVITQANIGSSDQNELTRAQSYLAYIIKEKYLDSSFFCYLALPDPETISPDDQAWLLKARNDEQNYEQKLNSPATVMRMLQESDYLDKAFLNISLLEQAIKDNPSSDAVKAMIKSGRDYSSRFVALAVESIPRFAYLSFKENSEYFKPIAKVDSSTVAVSIACFAGPEERGEINNALEVTLSVALSDGVGLIDNNRMNNLLHDCSNAYESIINTMLHYGVRCRRLSRDVDTELLNRILDKNLLVLSEENCETALHLLDSPRTDSELLDRLREANDQRIWNQILETPATFVDDYINENTRLSCSEKCFIELFNCFDPTEKQSASKLAEAFEGEIGDIKDIKQDSLWPYLEEYCRVSGTVPNILECLRKHGATTSWTKFVNETKNFALPEESPNKEDITVIQANFCSFTALSDERFNELCKLAGPESVHAMNEPISINKVDSLLSTDALILSQSTLNIAREGNEGIRLEFFSRHPKQYMEAVTQTGKYNNTEATKVLELLNVSEVEQSFANCISGQLVTSELDVESTTLGKLLVLNRIADPENVINKYGSIDELDELITRYSLTLSASVFNRMSPSISLTIEVLKNSKDDQMRSLCMSIISKTDNFGTLLDGMDALGSRTLNSLRNDSHPRLDELNVMEQSIAENLIAEKWLSKGPVNNRLYLKPYHNGGQ